MATALPAERADEFEHFDDQEVEVLDNVIYVRGKRVAFRTEFPVKENRRLGKLINAASNLDTDSQIQLLTYLIAEWDFDGNPRNPRSYDSLDALKDILAMFNKASRYISQLAGLDDAKN